MLSWLAGGPDEQDDFADTTFADKPDTPAHVFAARAFKYRLWGTPKPPDAVPQARGRPDSYYAGDEAPPMGAPVSPSKQPNGILMTPGTANLRRSKTVSWGAQKDETKVRERSQAMSRNKTAPIVPGKFPTPSRADMTALDAAPAQSPPETKLTEKLRHARSISEPQPAAHVDVPSKPLVEQQKVTEILSNPLIDWKDRYDQYSARTEREMKRLIAKQQAAKQYARKKDTVASQLAEDLQDERKKIFSLESQISSLTDEVIRMQKGLALAEARAKADPSRSIDDYDDHVPKPAPLRTRRSNDGPTDTTAPPIPKRSPSRRPPAPTTDKDIWASTMIVSPEQARKDQFENDFISSHLRRTRQTPPKPVPRPSLPGPKTEVNLLQPRDINRESTTPKQTPPSSRRRSTLYTPSSTRRRNTHHTPSRPSARRSRLATDKALPATPRGEALVGKDIDASLALPVPSPEAELSALPRRETFSTRPVAAVKPIRPVATDSSPFILDADMGRYDRLAMPYTVPSPSPKARTSLDNRATERNTHRARPIRISLNQTHRPTYTDPAPDALPALDRRDSANDTAAQPEHRKSSRERFPSADATEKQSRQDKENIYRPLGRIPGQTLGHSTTQGWRDEVGLQATPRRALDEERRAKAAARIAARRREREKERERGVLV
ncbi:hypothetical protein BDZ85DRAFT_323216 [Elsinoe ampelina]|uniref:Spindle pole body-associated protein cut12 domain-containing protein n=1 Tax=Elsinoe ampelina TaxID=302913 RepID=A0A6A6FY34_9PEZI|nr:hypothetical protein BDZ85DRAFT_323216 [Elsinoe ampelina]